MYDMLCVHFKMTSFWGHCSRWNIRNQWTNFLTIILGQESSQDFWTILGYLWAVGPCLIPVPLFMNSHNFRYDKKEISWNSLSDHSSQLPIHDLYHPYDILLKYSGWNRRSNGWLKASVRVSVEAILYLFHGYLVQKNLKHIGTTFTREIVLNYTLTPDWRDVLSTKIV